MVYYSWRSGISAITFFTNYGLLQNNFSYFLLDYEIFMCKLYTVPGTYGWVENNSSAVEQTLP
jgi:hypothetical protein